MREVVTIQVGHCGTRVGEKVSSCTAGIPWLNPTYDYCFFLFLINRNL